MHPVRGVALLLAGPAVLAAGCGLSADGTATGLGLDAGHDATFSHDEGGTGLADDSGALDSPSSDGTTTGDDSSVDAGAPLDGRADGSKDATSVDSMSADEGGEAGADAGDGSSDAETRDGDASSVDGDGDVDGGPVDASGADGGDASVDGGPGDSGRPDATSDAGGKGDASVDGGACDFNGTWASRLTIDVTWAPQGLNAVILASGTGQIKQWIKGVRTQTGMSTSDATVVCGIDLPDFQSTLVIGSETYGVRFPASLFDGPDGGGGYLPTFTVNAALSGLTPGSTYSTTTTAALLGLTLAQPTTAAWPSTVSTSVDMDKDGKSGVTANAAQGSPYSDIPTGIPAPFQPIVRANKLYLAIRQVTVVSGTLTDCDHMTGTVSIPQISSKYAIDSHVMGCALTAGGDCTSTQASFVDNTQPVFTPSGTTDFQSVRLPTGASCADVRAALP